MSDAELMTPASHREGVGDAMKRRHSKMTKSNHAPPDVQSRPDRRRRRASPKDTSAIRHWSVDQLWFHSSDEGEEWLDPVSCAPKYSKLSKSVASWFVPTSSGGSGFFGLPIPVIPLLHAPLNRIRFLPRGLWKIAGKLATALRAPQGNFVKI
jgi:hypothetical protein